MFTTLIELVVGVPDVLVFDVLVTDSLGLDELVFDEDEVNVEP